MITDSGHILSRYDISARHGFLPHDLPITRLPQSYYAPWETLLDQLQTLISECVVRDKVQALPILETTELTTESEWRRAYSVLSFLTHAYIWGDRTPALILPPSICRPYLEVADHFDLATTATYAALNLWNWVLEDPDADLTDPDNIRTLHTFTGMFDEEWFYIISVAVEAEGAKIMPVMLECFEAVKADNPFKTADLLFKISNHITRLGQILNRMHEKCDPEVFYHRIRPFLAGSKGMAAAGLPNGVFYDEGEGKGSWRQYSGGSNAQSSLIQMLDIMLGVKHHATGEHSSKFERVDIKLKYGYIEEMKRYMPSQHRRFLQYVTDNASIKAYALRCDANSAARKAYVSAIDSLTSFRDKHINIVARYIIAPSRRQASSPNVAITNIATASSNLTHNSTDSVQLCGTGGTHLIPFLKQTRDETRQTAGI